MAKQSAFFNTPTRSHTAADFRLEFQTPPFIAKYMVSLIPERCKYVCEPTPGIGNIVREIPDRYAVTAYNDFFGRNPNDRFDCIVMNPPFSSKWCFNVPDNLAKTGMQLGYHIMQECMQMSNHVIALMPWFTISDSDKRLREIKRYGLKSVTALPRKTFQYARIQTVVLEMERGYKGATEMRVYDCLQDHTKIELELTRNS
jgi:hypothetical protein